MPKVIKTKKVKPILKPNFAQKVCLGVDPYTTKDTPKGYCWLVKVDSVK